MNELQRAEYLSVLGVASYMPRFVLPLAPQPRQAELPPQEAAQPEPATPLQQMRAAVANPLPQSAAQMVVAPAEAGPAPQARATEAQVLRDIGAITEQTRVKPATQAAAVTQVAPPRQEVQPFVLSCWWLGEELLAVDSREPGAALPVEALFNNIARALGWHQLPREQDRLRWPLAENRFGPAADASEARDTCSSWLEAASARRPVKSIWLMGREARDFCAPVPLAQPVNDWNGIRVIAMPSLSQLLQEPQRKRALWQLLQKTYPEHTLPEKNRVK
ncbi:hypothetical protein SAMN04487965_2429 [Microbulbifer donghaiensis]|uniref:Uncharacterized protein n=1 Tax=Microbulbifer donghaiensis TaxID=494016 RepID=A0A1M5D784_9GAMM|nr:hypothetical protein [Microbulbifer donghaiensis]SHF62909.1 hypothetical protein SAMN04487965_2429 [Microbulbifer donghaiensis]